MNKFFSSKGVQFLFGKKVKPESLAIYPFLLLSLLVFCNLNGVLFSIFGISALGSPLMLLFSISILYLIPIKNKDFNWFFVSFISFLIIFLILGWISGLINYNSIHFTFSSAIKSTREILTAMIMVVTYYAYSIWVVKKGQIDILIILMFIFFLITLLAGVFENFLGLRESINTGFGDKERNLGFFGNPNQTGFQANLTMILGYYLYLKRKIGVVSLLTLIGLSSYGAVLTFSKSAIISNIVLMIIFSIYIFFYAFNRNIKKRYRSWKFIIILSLFIVLGFKFIITPFLEDLEFGQKKRVEAIIELVVKGEFNNKTTSERAGIFKNAIDLIRKKPILGYGLGSFSKGGLFKSSRKHGVHNLFLKIAGESGILVLFIFLLILFLIIVISLIKIQEPEGFLLFSYIVLFSLYSFVSHNTLGDKFSIGLFGVLLSFTYTNERKKIL